MMKKRDNMKHAVAVQNIPEGNPPGYSNPPCCEKCDFCRIKFEEYYDDYICKKYKLRVDRDCVCREYKHSGEPEIMEYIANEL